MPAMMQAMIGHSHSRLLRELFGLHGRKGGGDGAADVSDGALPDVSDDAAAIKLQAIHRGNQARRAHPLAHSGDDGGGGGGSASGAPRSK